MAASRAAGHDHEVIEPGRRRTEVGSRQVVGHDEALAAVAGREGVADDPRDREVHDAVLRRDRNLRADRPAGGRGEPGRREKARPVLERVERRLAIAGDDVEAAERREGGGIDRGNA